MIIMFNKHSGRSHVGRCMRLWCGGECILELYGRHRFHVNSVARAAFLSANNTTRIRFGPRWQSLCVSSLAKSQPCFVNLNWHKGTHNAFVLVVLSLNRSTNNEKSNLLAEGIDFVQDNNEPRCAGRGNNTQPLEKMDSWLVYKTLNEARFSALSHISVA